MFDTFFVKSSCLAVRLSAARFAGIVAVMLMTSPLLRADVYWSTSAGDWSVPSNWSSGLAPTGTDSAWIANGGTATVTTGGDGCATLQLGGSTGSGTVLMSAGGLGLTYLNDGVAGQGTFTQTGGDNSSVNAVVGPLGVYQLAGGTLSATTLSIQPGGQYQLGGGTLQINGGLVNQGVFSGGAGMATINAASGSLVDLSAGVWQNTGSIALNIGANSLTIVPAGFKAGVFGGYSNAGMVHTAGTTLTVAAGQGFAGWGAINDFVNNQGSIGTGYGGALNLNNGLAISGTGNVNLGTGNLTVNDTVSGISSGGLYEQNQYVGAAANAAFTQTGGYNDPAGVIYVGYSPGLSGTYSLSGSGQIMQYNPYRFGGHECIGWSGTGSFVQTGGFNGDPFYYFVYGCNVALGCNPVLWGPMPFREPARCMRGARMSAVRARGSSISPAAPTARALSISASAPAAWGRTILVAEAS